MVFSTDLDQSLQSIGLQQYCQILRNEGFETWCQLLDITEDDMIALDIKLGHRRRLQRAIQDVKQQAPDGVATNTLNHSPGSFRHDGPSRLCRSESTTQEGTTPTFHQAPPQKRKYRRHPKVSQHAHFLDAADIEKPDENAPERPPSAYVIFSNRVRERLKDQDLSFTEIAKIVGEQWQDPDPEERAACERQAQAMKETYYAQLTEYKKTPDYHIYQTYLVEFKAKHGEKYTKGAH
ncbi:high mobility group box domain-containing protein [Elsinoe ampelina]|uniref:High mobility group box domain-containing protein n=1 Tax=Elsinoe ampelina TaxID=302913 RepID=A0A6A6G915_9PEZI|nr:high mobility group box domain-containing protein [Elsinoe ampelina]